MVDSETSKQEYIDLFNEVVQRQTVVLGPDIAIIIAKKVKGLQFSGEGKVVDYIGDPQQILQLLINGYVNLSGMIVRKTIEPLLAKHPAAVAKVVAGATTGMVGNQAPGAEPDADAEKKEEG